MSLYNMVMGVHPTANLVLEWLGLDVEDCGRFRDAYITKGGNVAVFTRCGGGNRDDYEDMFARMRTHPNYLYDEDDDFDSTFATIYFTAPVAELENIKEYFKMIEEKGRQDLLMHPMDRFRKMIDNIGNV